MAEPTIKTDDQSRKMARRMRDAQWDFMARVARVGVVWVCWWDKDRRHYGKAAAEDLEVLGLIDGVELLEWFNAHEDWWTIGDWSDERYAAPVALTDTGRAALQRRADYDMEPVTWGLVEPGFQAVPAEAA